MLLSLEPSEPPWLPCEFQALAARRIGQEPLGDYQNPVLLDGRAVLLVAPMSQDHFVRYRELGLVQAGQEEHRTVARLLPGAFSLFAGADRLSATVSSLISAVHVLHSSDPDCDVSFSDPQLDATIFVSRPSARNTELRLAEMILHEAMHIGLTLLERKAAMIRDDSVATFSPWKLALRRPSGILHGYFVFVCILEWLRCLPECGYKLGRTSEIEDQLAALELPPASCFTEAGRELVDYLGIRRASQLPLN